MARRRALLRLRPLEDRTVPAALIADPTFGTNGFAALSGAVARDSFTTAVPTPDGGVLFAGSGPGSAATDTDIVLFKLTKAGAIDTTFGTAGRVTLDSGLKNVDGTPGIDSLSDLRILADGRIAATGTASVTVTATSGSSTFQSSSSQAVAYRLSAAGALDAGYDGDGKLLIGPASIQIFDGRPVVTPTTAKLQPDGTVVGLYMTDGITPGTPQGTETVTLNALRLTPAGTPDPTFDGDGQAQIRLASYTTTSLYLSGSPTISGVLVRPTGAIVFGLGFNTTGFNTLRSYAVGTLGGLRSPHSAATLSA